MPENPNMIKKGKNAGIIVYLHGFSTVLRHFSWPLNMMLLLYIPECAIIKVYDRKKKYLQTIFSTKNSKYVIEIIFFP